MYSRRAFLKMSGLALFAAGVGGSPVFLARAAQAAQQGSATRRRTLVTIFQRGAMDGLMAVPPIEDPYLRQSRPNLYIPAGRAAGDQAVLELTDAFGLHPAFAPLLPLFREGRLAVVHGVGSPVATRSHFDAQDYMESGTPGRKGTASGWLNRAVGLLGHEPATPFQAVSLTPSLPKSLYGERKALAVSDLATFGVQDIGNRQMSAATQQGFEMLYSRAAAELLQKTGSMSFDAVKILSELEVASYRPENGADYPRSPLGSALKQIAMLIKAGVGLEVAFAESGGWDTHVRQGALTGTFANRSRDLAAAIAAFWADLDRYQDDVVVMTMTEFGRTVRENGSAGTDHGRASCLFVLGNQVRGGRVHGQVPVLARENLEDGRDLPVTTDFRAVFADVAGQHLRIDDDSALFPGWSGRRLPVLKS